MTEAVIIQKLNKLEYSPLICRLKQWTGFCMITAAFMKELKPFIRDRVTTWLPWTPKRKLDSFLKLYAHSTLHALTRLLQSWQRALFNSVYIGIMIMDLSKAYNFIPHDSLIAKSEAYGLDKTSLHLLIPQLSEAKDKKGFQLQWLVGCNLWDATRINTSGVDPWGTESGGLPHFSWPTSIFLDIIYNKKEKKQYEI